VFLRFGDHVLEVERCELRRRPEPVALEPQVFDLLVYLVRNRGRVVSKDDLIQGVWGGRIAIFTRTIAGSGHNACHQSASGIVVAGKKPIIMRLSCKGLYFLPANGVPPQPEESAASNG
jgi:hypothetical protein